MIDKDTRLTMETIVNDAANKARWLWLTYIKAIIRGVLLSLVLGLEFEILYRTFQGIAGDSNEYWSPELMAMTGIIMVTAFHLLARLDEDHIALRSIRTVTPWLLALYLVGLGLLTSGIINLDASGVLLQDAGSIVIGSITETSTADSEPLSWLFKEVTNPLALMFFSLGIGGLAIVNLFVAHELVTQMHRNISHIHHAKDEADRLKGEHKTFLEKEEQVLELQQSLKSVKLWSKDSMMYETTLLLSALIHETASKHREFIKGRDLAPAPGPVSIQHPIDPKLIERDLKKIEALDLKAISKLLNTYPTTGDKK